MNADEILRRIVDMYELNHLSGQFGPLDRNVDDARAYLSREKGPVAEGVILFYKQSDGSWAFSAAMEREDFDDPDACLPLRVAVPAHIVNPPVIEGEVVEGS